MGFANLMRCVVRRAICFARSNGMIDCCAHWSRVDSGSIGQNCRLGSQTRIGEARANAEHPQDQREGCPSMQVVAVSKHGANFRRVR